MVSQVMKDKDIDMGKDRIKEMSTGVRGIVIRKLLPVTIRNSMMILRGALDGNKVKAGCASLIKIWIHFTFTLTEKEWTWLG